MKIMWKLSAAKIRICEDFCARDTPREIFNQWRPHIAA